MHDWSWHTAEWTTTTLISNDVLPSKAISDLLFNTPTSVSLLSSAKIQMSPSPNQSMTLTFQSSMTRKYTISSITSLYILLPSEMPTHSRNLVLWSIGASVSHISLGQHGRASKFTERMRRSKRRDCSSMFRSGRFWQMLWSCWVLHPSSGCDWFSWNSIFRDLHSMHLGI